MDLDTIRELLDLMDKHGLGELRLEDGDNKITLKKAGQEAAAPGLPPMMYAAPGMGAAPAAPAPAPGAEAPAQATAGAGDEGLIEVRSPCVGTFFRAPRPESEPFVVEGDPVEAETTVCIVEAMKVMNEVRAEHHGTVEKFLVSNGDAVEYDQVLMLIAP